MSIPRTCLFLVLFAATSGARAGGAEPAAPNAALAHWQAFALLPATDKDQDQLLKQAATVPLDEAVTTLIRTSEASLTCLQRAAQFADCDWGLDFAAGPHVMLPHLSKARQLARFAILHARERFSDGDPKEAVRILGDALVLAKHTGVDHVLISVLVQYAIESECVEALARHLPDLDEDQLEALSQRLDGLPEGGSPMAALQLEKEICVGWARRVVRDASDDEEAVRALMSMAADYDASEPATPGITRDQINRWLDDTSKDYDEVFAIYELPAAEFEARWKALLERLEDGNPYSRMVLPGVKSIRDVHDRNTALWALLRAAIAVSREGDDGLQAVEDPFGDGPFLYTELEHGFRLTSGCKFRGEAVRLTVGRNDG